MGDPGIIPPSRVTAGVGFGSQGGASAALAALSSWHQERGGEGKDKPHPNYGSQRTQDLNALQINARAWFNWEAKCPTIMLPLTSEVVTIEGGAALAGSQFEIYYAPNRTPIPLPAALTPEEAMRFAEVSRGCGVVYLPKPGRWSIYWNAPNNSSKLRMLLIDASDSAVAARYLFDDGIHQVSVNTTVTVTVADAIILPSNRLRKGFVISQDGANVTNPARLGFNAAAAAAAGVKVGTANQPSSFSMSGENCFKGNVHGIRDAAAVADVTLSVVEWY